MALAELNKLPDVVQVIPDSGLQFLDFGVRVGKGQAMPERWGFHADAAWPLTSENLPVLVRREIDGEEQALPGKPNCEIELRDIEMLFATPGHEQWLPLPLFRRDLSGTFFRGPTNWARVLLRREAQADDDGHTHRLVVVLDTRLAPFIETEAYAAPAPNDAKSGRPFALPAYTDAIDWYLAQDWIRDWCLEIAKDWVAREERRTNGGRPVPTPTTEQVQARLADEGKPMLHLAAYRAFLDWLHTSGVVPSIVIVDRETQGAARPIDVDLVLDLGNSRSCGLLIEDDDDDVGTDITKAIKLALRDLSQPWKVYRDPFSSRLEFSRASFGRDHLSLRSGLADRFSWPSIVRVGPEAQRLAGLRRGSEGASGLSSPKRYLWDEDARRDSWRFNSPFIQGEQSDIATGVAFTTLVNDLGEPLHRVEQGPGLPIENSFPSIRALYARRSLMSFALAEILIQSLSMMNSVAHRAQRAASAGRPRRLRRLIMTMPTAMSLSERQILAQQAESACELAYMALGLAEPGADGQLTYAPDVRRSAAEPHAGPEVRLQWDEASATQAIYLYTQIALNHSGDARAFFDTMRHPANRSDPAGRDALRIATLDIGGGTTDLVITRLTVEGRGANVTVTPLQEFREGFNLAGDDAVLSVVRAHVLEPLRRHLADGPLGRDRADAVLSQLFGGDRGDMKVIDQLRRQQFAAQIAAPIAIRMLAAYETHDPASPAAAERRPFADFFAGDEPPPDFLIDHVNAEIRKAGADGFDLRRVEFPVDPASLDVTVRAVFKDMLEALAEMVWRYRCDLLLLSGRPSRLPAVAGILGEAGALPPHRILPLHAFRVGGWYPFRDLRATIADPKTTAAVGAMICLLSEGRLVNFNFRADQLKTASTARFFGKLDRTGRLLAADEFYRDMKLDDPEWQPPEEGFEFHGPMPLGFRQVAADWWPGTRLYQLSYAEDARIAELRPRTPLKVRLKRDKGDRRTRVHDKFLVARIEDREGRTVAPDQLRLRLQTIDNQAGYWLDTGILLDQ